VTGTIATVELLTVIGPDMHGNVQRVRWAHAVRELGQQLRTWCAMDVPEDLDPPPPLCFLPLDLVDCPACRQNLEAAAAAAALDRARRCVVLEDGK